LPAQTVAGEPLTVEIEVRNARRWLSSWLITVEDWIRREDERRNVAPEGRRPAVGSFVRHWRGRGRTHAQARIAHVPAGGAAMGTYRITIFRRGKYRLGPLRISTRFPLGLVRGHVTISAPAELIVSPRMGRLLPPWSYLLEAELVGDERRHPHRGMTEGDYYGLRPWQQGDSLRWVHWRTTAKLSRPMVRQFERRRGRDVAFVLDPWSRDEHFAELAISVVATAVHDLGWRGHSRLTLVVAGREPLCFSGPASATFCEELLAQLAVVNCGEGYELGPALQLAAETAPTGSRIVVISPRGPADASLTNPDIDLAFDPEDVAWIDVSGKQLESLFLLT
jgi:hypothetical protein